MSTSPTSQPPKPFQTVLTFLIIATGSILFCAKGVVIKLGYREGSDALEIVALRMAFALPCFVAMTLFAQWKARERLTASEWGQVLFLGFIGYYLSALINFSGLRYVSVGLERILLYTYPTLVLIITALFLRRRVAPNAWVAAAIVWGGIALAFAGEISNQADPLVLLGSLLVLGSAITYAVYVVASADLIPRIGPLRFTGLTGTFACLYSLAHYAMTRGSDQLLHLTPVLYQYGVILAVLSTIIPMALLAVGLQRAGAAKFAVISAVGPVATVVLAAQVLHEKLNAWQIAGLAVTVAGGVLVSLFKQKPAPAAGAAVSSRRCPHSP